MDDQSSAMFGCSWTEVSVLGRQLFEQATMKSCVIISFTTMVDD